MNIDHLHCPFDCEHPQPIEDEAVGKWYCGRCWFLSKERVEMVLCNPEICED